MISIPLADIKAKIKEQTSLSEEEVNNKIKSKLDQLSGLISEEGAAHIIANELGVKLVKAGEKLTVKNILAGMKDVEVAGKVTRKFELKEFQTEKRSGKLASFVIADETGFIRVVLWNDQTDKFSDINEGITIKIQGGYVKENNGRKEIHLGDRGNITINPEGVKVEEIKSQVATRKKLSELAQGDENVEVLATIVQVFDIRFFEIDPETGRRATEKEGKFYSGDKEITNPGYAYVMNIFIDDGSDNLRTVLWRNQIQNLLGMSDEEVLKIKDDPSSFETTKTELLGAIVKITGRVNLNQAFDRIELIANRIIKDVNPEEEIKNLETNQEVKSETSETTQDNSREKSSSLEEEKIQNQEITSEKTIESTNTTTENSSMSSELKVENTVTETTTNKPIVENEVSIETKEESIAEEETLADDAVEKAVMEEEGEEKDDSFSIEDLEKL